ncbi:MAG: plasmid recombination protein [Lachnospiraceae bacterium]|nr:plasmid recombination protein [Lachnospiraceae bacterium]
MKGFHVGLPCMKLSLNPSSQKHNGKAAKTCSVRCAWNEMNDERRGKDKTIDHELTKENVWISGNTNMDMEKVIQTEIDRINNERVALGKRKLRTDAVSAIELIQKPPMEVMESLTREEQTKLLRDSDKVVESIMHDWCPEWKTLATVIHYDEFGGRAGHPHKIFMPLSRDEDGCPVLNAKRDLSLKFFTFMNIEYPARMREMGYPVLDCEIYEDMTQEEREAHKEKKKDYGLEGYEYKLKKTAEQEAQIKANEQLIDGQTEILSIQDGLIAENDKVIAEQDGKISQAEQTLSDVKASVRQEKETLKTTKEAVDAGKAEIEKQKDRSKELNIKILSKEQVKDLREPDMTFDKKCYKVPKQEYKRILATAGQVDIIKEEYVKKEKALENRSRELDRRESDIEKSRRLPWKEKQELVILRQLKKGVEWVAQQPFVPESVRKLLTRALGGENLAKQQGLDVPEKQRKTVLENL